VRIDGIERSHGLTDAIHLTDVSQRPAVGYSAAVGETDLERLTRLEHELEQARASARRAESERDRLLRVVEATSDVVCLKDLTGHLLYLNGAGRRLVGLADDADVTRTRIGDLHPRWAADQLRDEVIPKAIVGGRWAGETAFLSRTGEEVPASFVVCAHRDAQGELLFLSMIARDLTERKRLEAQVQQAGRMESLGRLAGAVAHDFNNLLTAVLANTELALEHSAVASDAELRDMLRDVREASSRGTTIAQQLLTFARQQITEPRVTRLGEVVRRAQMLLARVLGPNIKLVVELGAEHDTVRFDPDRFVGQVLMNLAINAREAMPKGGTLTLRTRDGTENYAGAVVLELVDTGVGMNEEVAAHIFEPFYTTKERGTGLGLATAYGIVSQCGGNIRVESVEEVGTTFRIALPVHRAEGRASTTPLPTGTPAPEGHETVLVIDDDEAVRAVTARTLRRQGYHVLEAPDGELGEQLASAHFGPIHLLISDVLLPGIHGPELAARICALRTETRVLLMSGRPDDPQVQEWLDHRGATFLAKPFSVRALSKLVRAAIG
jgi:PAS domain S-box-containing protein